MVIWITGLSGSGKTTLCRALCELLKPRLPELVLLDGDAIRVAFGDDLGYSEEDRKIQVRRLQNLARILADQGLVVLVAVLYSHPELSAWNRQHIREYFEIFLDASIDFVRKRDVKGLYTRAAQGEVADVVGVDIPWHAPTSPDLVIAAETAPPPEALARRVIAAIPRLAQLWR